jgi:hypothetical protein
MQQYSFSTWFSSILGSSDNVAMVEIRTSLTVFSALFRMMPKQKSSQRRRKIGP